MLRLPSAAIIRALVPMLVMVDEGAKVIFVEDKVGDQGGHTMLGVVIYERAR